MQQVYGYIYHFIILSHLLIGINNAKLISFLKFSFIFTYGFLLLAVSSHNKFKTYLIKKVSRYN